MTFEKRSFVVAGVDKSNKPNNTFQKQAKVSCGNWHRPFGRIFNIKENILMGNSKC
jgi:hypothetical protein